MGGKSRTSTTNAGRETTTSLGDNRVTDSGSIGGNIQLGETQADGDISITTTDFGALDSAQGLSMAALDFGSDAVEGGFDFAEEALMSNSDLAEQFIDVGGGLFSEALGAINSSNEDFTKQSGAQFTEALGFATRSNTSEGTQVLQGGLKIVAVIAIVIGLVFVLKGKS